MCIIVILCVEETYYYICVNIVMQYNYPNPWGGGGGYRISHFLMAKEVIKEVKKKLQHQCPTIKYYENTKYALNRKVAKTKSAQLSCI
jgi:hypothetical protein